MYSLFLVNKMKRRAESTGKYGEGFSKSVGKAKKKPKLKNTERESVRYMDLRRMHLTPLEVLN